MGAELAISLLQWQAARFSTCSHITHVRSSLLLHITHPLRALRFTSHFALHQYDRLVNNSQPVASLNITPDDCSILPYTHYVKSVPKTDVEMRRWRGEKEWMRVGWQHA